MTMVMSKQ